MTPNEVAFFLAGLSVGDVLQIQSANPARWRGFFLLARVHALRADGSFIIDTGRDPAGMVEVGADGLVGYDKGYCIPPIHSEEPSLFPGIFDDVKRAFSPDLLD